MPDALDLPSYASRLFGVPLLIQPQKLDTILTVLGPRLGLDQSRLTVDVKQDDIAAIHGDVMVSDKPYKITTDGIAIIPIIGTLVKRSGGLRALSGMTSYQRIEDMVLDAATDDGVKAIILDVDSNGGEVSGLFDLTDAIAEIRSIKPIWSVANDAMYSAAYALGSAASKIYVTRTAGVGSIGVVALHLDQSAYDKQNGLKYTYIHAGTHKVDGNPHNPLDEGALSAFQAEIDRLYDLFVKTVSANRGVSEDIVRGTEARTYDGYAAISLGLADHIGTLDFAIADMKKYLSTPSAQTRGLAQGTIISKKEKLMPDEQAAGGAITPEQIEQGADTSANLDQVRTDAHTQGHADALAYVNDVNETCALAGCPAAAAGFLKDNTSVADVRSALLKRAADQDTAAPISGSHLGKDVDADVATIDTAGIYASRRLAMKGGLKDA